MENPVATCKSCKNSGRIRDVESFLVMQEQGSTIILQCRGCGESLMLGVDAVEHREPMVVLLMVGAFVLLVVMCIGLN
ncbi:MAG TPA: hypothetical protein QGF58_08360 [Myxococcota bacterium]|nr:hypothetical protein [Myxococcota bacterium]